MSLLFQTSIFITITAIILLIVKRILKNKISARVQFLLWALLFIRLLTPLLPECDFSLFNVISAPYELTDLSTIETYEDKELDIESEVSADPEFKLSLWEKFFTTLTWPGFMSSVIEKFVVTIWAVIALILLVKYILVYIICLRRTKKLPLITDTETIEILNSCKKVMDVNREVKSVTSNKSPMLIGFLKPVITLPDGYSNSEKRDVFIHELCHLKHCDTLFIWLAIIILSLNWFNPIIWYCFYMFRNDIELYCDERALKYAQSKKEYASLLLKTAMKESRFIAGTTSIYNGEEEVEKRITHMACYKKPKIIWCALVLICILAVSVGCLTNCSQLHMCYAKYELFKLRPCMTNVPYLPYADENKAVIWYEDGLFVYDFNKMEIDKRYDLSSLNSPLNTQGSYISDVEVTKDGKMALLRTLGFDSEVQYYDNYLIDLENGSVIKTELTELENAYDTSVELNVYSEDWAIGCNTKNFVAYISEGGYNTPRDFEICIDDGTQVLRQKIFQ